MEVREERISSVFVCHGGSESMDPLTIDSIEDIKPVVACRGCLVTEQPLRPLDHRLAATYGMFISPVQDCDIYPKYICTYCCALLLRFTSFREKCLSVQTALARVHSVGTPITFNLVKSGIIKNLYPLRATKIKIININPHYNQKTFQNLNTITSKCSDSNDTVLSEFKSEENYLEIEINESNFDNDVIDIKFDPKDDIVLKTNHSNFSNEEANVGDKNNKFGKDIFEENTTNKKPVKCKVKVNKKGNKTTIEAPQNDANIIEETSVNEGIYDEVSLNADDIDPYISDDTVVDQKVNNKHKRKVKKKTLGKLKKSKKLQLLKKNEDFDVEFYAEKSHTEIVINDEEKLPKYVMNEDLAKTDRFEHQTHVKDIKSKVKQQRNLYIKKESDFANKLDVKVILLTKEDQIKQMEERKDSSNYKRAKYKCDLCFKGYNLNTTFKNHMAKHKLTEGHVRCEICNLSFAKSKLSSHVTNYHKYNYICNQCGNVSKSPDVAKIHFKWHSGVQYDCKICGKAFDKPSSVMGHMHLSHGGNTKCSICDKKCIGERGLKSHMQKSHKEAIGAVCECGVQFHSAGSLKKHRPLCDQTLRPCVACGEGFSSEILFKQHQSQCQTLQKVLNYRCEICGKSFDDKSRYYAHHHYNNKQRPPRSAGVGKADSDGQTLSFMCEMCGCIKNSKNSLDYHVRSTHSNVKPFQCDYCAKGFSDKRNLQIHITKHMSAASQISFGCRFCHKQFTYDSNRQRHEYAVHHRRRPHKCHICEKTFQDSTSMKAHIKHTHEGVPWPKRQRNRR